jgi:uncharacterized membrane protein YiaA
MTMGAPPAGRAGATPQIKFDASVLSQTDRIIGLASLVLFISLFLPWFTAGAAGVSGSESGLSAHGYLYVVLILALIVVAYFVATALRIWSIPANSALSRDQALLIITAINVVLVIIAFVFKPSGFGIVSVGWGVGAFIGLIAAIVAFLPMGRPFIAARRKR